MSTYMHVSTITGTPHEDPVSLAGFCRAWQEVRTLIMLT